jgi:hypothetical protein
VHRDPAAGRRAVRVLELGRAGLLLLSGLRRRQASSCQTSRHRTPALEHVASAQIVPGWYRRVVVRRHRVLLAFYPACSLQVHCTNTVSALSMSSSSRGRRRRRAECRRMSSPRTMFSTWAWSSFSSVVCAVATVANRLTVRALALQYAPPRPSSATTPNQCKARQACMSPGERPLPRRSLQAAGPASATAEISM